MDKFKDGSCLPKTLTENALKVYILRRFKVNGNSFNLQPVQIPQKMIFYTLHEMKIDRGTGKNDQKIYRFKLIKIYILTVFKLVF